MASKFPTESAFSARWLAIFMAALASAACSSSDTVASRAQADAAVDSAGGAPTSGDVDAGPLPTLAGPITGGSTGKPFTASVLDLKSVGYVEEEYFLEGDASAYGYRGTPGMDGAWSVDVTGTAHYKTRILVRRPTDASKFNGTVFVEWLNVSAGIDADPEFVFGHAELLRSGFAYVGVSAQAQGVIGGGFSLVAGTKPLVQTDPERYGSLMHPGDDYSYDIFTQAARVLRHPGAVRPLGNLKPHYFLADGESQSAFRMVTYVDAVQPVSHAFDGFLIHSRASGGAPLSSGMDPTAIVGGPASALIRDDLDVPVLQFETETDVLGLAILGGFAAARQPDTSKLRSWEIAGTSHADRYLMTAEVPAGGLGDAGAPVAAVNCPDVNSGPQHWVLDTAIRAVQAWMKSGALPASGAELTLTEGGTGYAHDEFGNALGGIRTAAVDVPIATYSGQGDPSNILCALFGSTTPFSPGKLAKLYPTHDDYVTKVVAATAKAEQAGFILADDAPLIQTEAESANIPE